MLTLNTSRQVSFLKANIGEDIDSVNWLIKNAVDLSTVDVDRFNRVLKDLQHDKDLINAILEDSDVK